MLLSTKGFYYILLQINCNFENSVEDEVLNSILKYLYYILFTQVPTADQLPTKICHKCAYELNQCSSFVTKYKRCTTIPRKQTRNHYCSLCFEPTKKEYIFNLSKDKTLECNLLHKIQKLFNNEVRNILYMIINYAYSSVLAY